MSFSIKKNKITLTRGDTLKTTIAIKDKDGTPYIPSEGDTILFAVKKSIEDIEPIFSVDIPWDTLLLHIKPEHTKGMDYGTYVYDCSITMANGDIHTFITYTDFILTGEVG